MKAAEAGNFDAQYRVGWSYEHGTGTDRDIQKALEWYTRTAEGKAHVVTVTPEMINEVNEKCFHFQYFFYLQNLNSFLFDYLENKTSQTAHISGRE
jgi:hypothetical protein